MGIQLESATLQEPVESCSWLCENVVWLAWVMSWVICMVVVCSRRNQDMEEANLQVR